MKVLRQAIQELYALRRVTPHGAFERASVVCGVFMTVFFATAGAYNVWHGIVVLRSFKGPKDWSDAVAPFAFGILMLSIALISIIAIRNRMKLSRSLKDNP